MKEEQTSLFKMPKIKSKKARKTHTVHRARTHKTVKSKKNTNQAKKPVTITESSRKSATKLTKPKQTKPEMITETDKIYEQYKTHHLVNKTQIYPKSVCVSIVLDYINGNQKVLGETEEQMCKQLKHMHSHCYYHFVNYKFLQYDAWLMKMVLRSELQHANQKSND